MKDTKGLISDLLDLIKYHKEMMMFTVGTNMGKCHDHKVFISFNCRAVERILEPHIDELREYGRNRP